MAFVASGFKTNTHIGTLAGLTGTMRSFHMYVTSDDADAVETDGYFDSIAARFKTGDLLICSLDIEGTPTPRMYAVTSASGDVTLSRDPTAVTGDQSPIDELTDSTGGTADGTLADVGASFTQATLNNNFADVAERINEIRAVLVSSGLTATP